MAEIEFNFEGNITIIQCNINDRMEDIINLFLIRTNNNQNFYYLYNGSRINTDLTFNEQANEIDRNRMKMNVLVYNANEEINEIISKDVICPDCKENILIDIKDDFKINLHECKNNHNKDNILLHNFEECQKIKLNEIVCNICNTNHKKNINDKFYFCGTCNKNICIICKSNHDQDHIIIDYQDKNYICKKHNESYIKYCKNCKEDICIICEKEHKKHDIFDFSEMLINKNDLLKIIDDLENIINRFKYKVNIIKEILNKTVNIFDNYYKINRDIINNYNINKRNYFKLQNTNYLKNRNEILIKELNNIINDDKINEY